tara:strand:+ start:25 stop:603 length:579 start_codon:yes stop_codon:yes gene_type:complete
MKISKTNTAIFMLPTVKHPKNSLIRNNFINAYMKDMLSENNYENCIYVLFKPSNLERFKEFLDNEYERTQQIVEDYDYEGGFVVVVYELKKAFIKDFKLIKQGKYSKTSEEFQKLFPKILKLTKNGLHRDELSLQYRIFNKTNDLVEYWKDKIGRSSTWEDDYEVWSSFEENKEVLTKKILNENRKTITRKS